MRELLGGIYRHLTVYFGWDVPSTLFLQQLHMAERSIVGRCELLMRLLRRTVGLSPPVKSEASDRKMSVRYP